MNRPDILHAESGEMASQIGLVHRRCRMPAHGRVTVEPEDIATGAEGREQIGKGAVATERRLAADDGNGFVRHVFTQGCGRHRDVSALRRAVEGRAAFVVQDADAEIAKERTDRRELDLHLVRRHRARRARDPHGFQVTGLRQLLRFRHAQEEKGTAAAPRQRRERVRRSGEVVSVPSVGRRHGGLRPLVLREEAVRVRERTMLRAGAVHAFAGLHGAPGLANAGDAFRRPAGMSHDSAARHEEKV